MSKKIKWTNADAKRAEKMGWQLVEHTHGCLIGAWMPSPFKTDYEAVEWVVNAMVGNDWILGPSLKLNESDWVTCKKALLLCAGGGR